jgi:hypothetical protein
MYIFALGFTGVCRIEIAVELTVRRIIMDRSMRNKNSAREAGRVEPRTKKNWAECARMLIGCRHEWPTSCHVQTGSRNVFLLYCPIQSIRLVAMRRCSSLSDPHTCFILAGCDQNCSMQHHENSEWATQETTSLATASLNSRFLVHVDPRHCICSSVSTRRTAYRVKCMSCWNYDPIRSNGICV